MIWIFWSICF